MKKSAIALALSTALVGSAFAAEDSSSDRIPHLDHAFVIVMENHPFSQIIGNSAAPFINSYAKTANLAANYFAVGHPSLTNYLELVGASNFGVVNDNSPDWHNTTCQADATRNTLKTPQLEGALDTCPIAGSGYDAETPAVDTTNEGTPAVPVINEYVAPAWTQGKTIADQLVEAGKTWKSYQENLPASGPDGANWSDGLLTNHNFDTGAPVVGIPHLYAVKHNPFAYFANVQAGTDPDNSFKNIVGFDQLYADLTSGHVPNYSLIAPNQCHDQHERGASEVGTGCQYDPDPVNNVLNPAGIAQGDAAVQALVTKIKSSPVWKSGHSAIIVVWDENDYTSKPNQVVTIVDTNYGVNGVSSNVKYNHFSLVKTLEAGFGLDYLNHAADKDVKLMSDLFAHR
jgi:hypothetical protein